MESPPYRLLDSWREQEARNEAAESQPRAVAMVPVMKAERLR